MWHLQIIIKLKTQIDNVSLQSLSSTRNKDYIGIIDYNVYDTNGNKLNSFNIEKQRTITYSNGTTEEWAPGDIGTYKDFYGATMNLTEYIIIEKKCAKALHRSVFASSLPRKRAKSKRVWWRE